jgi:hypothetical protein
MPEDVMNREDDRVRCKLDIHKEIWDLTGYLTAEWKNAAGEPCHFVHEDQASSVTVELTLGGTILHYLCNTSICCCLAFESCGSGSEFEVCQWKEIHPCEKDGHIIKFKFDIAPGLLKAGECGKQYRLCVTLGSKDCCGHSGFIYGTCHDLTITVLPTDVNA